MPSLMIIEFADFNKNPVSKGSFNANFHCRGIAFFEQNLYTAGGGFDGEEQGQVNIFNTKGIHLRMFQKDLDGNHFFAPRSLLVEANAIYVTDCKDGGAVCLDFEGRWKWKCIISKLTYPWGVCFTTNGNLLISGRDSNNIVVVSKDGKYIGDLLNKNDAIAAPKAICIDKQNSRLLVAESKMRHLKIFYFDDGEICSFNI
jgi:hypothetical protein